MAEMDFSMQAHPNGAAQVAAAEQVLAALALDLMHTHLMARDLSMAQVAAVPVEIAVPLRQDAGGVLEFTKPEVVGQPEQREPPQPQAQQAQPALF